MRIACRFLAAAAVMLVLSSHAWAQVVPMPLSREIYTHLKPAVEEPTPQVAAFIRALDDESAATRRNARQALLDMGMAIQPQLRMALEAENKKKEANPAVMSHARPELMVLISQLDDARFTKTSIVTLHRKDAPLVDTLREFGIQVEADVKITGDTLGDKLEWLNSAKVSLDIERLDYWSALRAIRKQLGFIEDLPNLSFHRPRLNQEWAHMREPKEIPYDVEGAIVAGPLLIVPSPLETRGQNLVLTLRAAPEARLADGLRSAGRHAILQIDEYTDDRGQSLLPSGQPLAFDGTSLDIGNAEGWKWRIDAVLPRPAAGHLIGSLKGRFGVSSGPPGWEVVAVDLTRGTGEAFEFDGIGVRVTSVVPPSTFAHTLMLVAFIVGCVAVGPILRRVGRPWLKALGTVLIGFAALGVFFLNQAGWNWGIDSEEKNYTVKGELFAPTSSPMARTLLTGHPYDNFGLRDKSGAEIPRDAAPEGVRSEGGVTTMTWTLNGRAFRDASGVPRSGIPMGGELVTCTANCVPAALTWGTPPDTHWIQTAFELRNLALPPATR